MIRGKTIQLFLPDGNPRGVKIAEFTSRTIQAVLVPRAQLDFACSRAELGNVGIYFLFGDEAGGSVSLMKSSKPLEPSEDNERSYIKEQLDWYLPGRTKAPQQSPKQTNDADRPSHFHIMIQKLHIGTTLAALVLFFLPWIDIQCSEKSMATQTGVQSIYGGGSLSKDLEAFGEEDSQIQSDSAKKDESMGYSPLVALALLAVVGAVVVSFRALRSSDESQCNLVGILCAAALVLVSAQMMIGFPVKNNFGKGMAEASKTATSGDPMGDLGGGMAAAMMMQIQVRHLPALYLTLIMLGLPTLVLANSLIDRMKKS